MNGLLRLIIMESLAMLVVFIWVIYCIVKKKKLLPEILEEKEDIVAKVLVLVAIAIVVVNRIIPKCMDIPYYNNNEFCYIAGVAQNHSDKSGKGSHTVVIKDEDSGEEISVRFGYKGTIEQGDQLKVKYLPNSKRAILLEINGRKTGAG